MPELPKAEELVETSQPNLIFFILLHSKDLSLNFWHMNPYFRMLSWERERLQKPLTPVPATSAVHSLMSTVTFSMDFTFSVYTVFVILFIVYMNLLSLFDRFFQSVKFFGSLCQDGVNHNFPRENEYKYCPVSFYFNVFAQP